MIYSKSWHRWIYVCFSLFFSVSTATKKALIIGITGQDGRYLTDFLAEKGYEIHGTYRQGTSNFSHLLIKNVYMHLLDNLDKGNMINVLKLIKPDEIYNLAAQSHVGFSFRVPVETFKVNGLASLILLEAVRQADLSNYVKIFQASTSELFGNNPKNDSLLYFNPQSPYAVAKLYSYWITKNYRESYNIFACNGILFNHESPYRSLDFVTRKIARAVVHIKYNKQEVLYLGNLDIKKDWGYAKDYVECMWLMLQQDKPDDYVIATGKLHSLREFVEYAFKEVDIDIIWKNTQANEIGINKNTDKVIIKINPSFYRPLENSSIQADIEKTYKKLQWKATTSFEELVRLMVRAECDILEKSK